ncbi:MAG TPA: MASE3 domain-containing protein [Noviherbaspirillum sp.]|nr:MASE3 domain-containing protein [Noviherbaspirillum sp.]
MTPTLFRAEMRSPSPLRSMELMLLLLTVACAAVWRLPGFAALHGVPLMPLWLHTLMELFSVTVALLLFGLVWNAYSRKRSGNIVILSCAALAVGLIDIAHMLSYRGMPDFITPSSPAKAINFWLAARLISALALLAVAFRPPVPFARSGSRYLVLAASLAATALVYWLGLFRPSWWPETFIDGSGLTGFKIVAEWVIITFMATAAVLLYRRARNDQTYDAASFFGIAVIGILSELCFTAYVSVTDIFNLLGHLLKIVFYLFLYRAGFVSSVREPFQRLRVEIGERLRAEDALRQLNLSLEQRVAQRTRQLEQANRELEAFSYSVSHDLRAPLRAIDGFSQILGRNYEALLDAKGKDYLDRVRRASQRMGELIDDILYLSHVSRQETVRSTVDVTQLAQDIARDLRQGDPERAVEFVIAPGMQIDADPKLIRIALENLIGNAWKFTGRQPAARIEVGLVSDAGVPALFVRDNGAGFGMEYAHKLFNAFQRLHAASEFDGTGIGLATVQRIAHKHGGRTWAEGKEGEGATFYFSCGSAAAEQPEPTHA